MTGLEKIGWWLVGLVAANLAIAVTALTFVLIAKRRARSRIWPELAKLLDDGYESQIQSAREWRRKPWER